MISAAQRRSLLTAALGFSQLSWHEPMPPVVALASWLNTWRGIGSVLLGMAAQGFNVELKQFPDGWRANFYPVGIAHSVVVGSAYEPTLWTAVQRAAWETLTQPRDRSAR